MEWLLGKREHQKLQVVRFLYQQNKTSVPLIEVERHFNVSKYMAKTLLTEIVADETRFGIVNTAALKFEDKGGMISWTPGYQVNIMRLEYFYTIESHALAMLIRGMSDSPISAATFADQLDIAGNHLVTDRTLLNERLAGSGVSLSSNMQLVGSESTIRIMMYRVLADIVETEADLTRYFPEQILSLTRQTVAFFEGNHVVSLNNVQRMRLFVFLGVWITRLQSSQTIDRNEAISNIFESTIEHDDELKMPYRTLRAIVLRYRRLMPECLDAEANFAMGVLMTDAILHGNMMNHATPALREMYNVVFQSVQTTYREFFKEELPESQNSSWPLLLIQPVVVLMFLRRINYQAEDGMATGHTLYPTYKLFTQKVLRHVGLAFDEQTDTILRRMEIDFYNAFLQALPREKMLPTIRVRLDYQDNLLAQHIQRMIMTTEMLNVVFVTDEAETPDIVIADRLTMSDETTLFVWPSSPSFAEYDIFLHTATKKMMAIFETQIY
ncbi:hypothetical protein ABMD20_05565 [Weissella confusa]|uniref:hypothetical protein n=1 Tax=Weissella confusa TaxID=1583 RepID=UPI00396F427B